MSNYYQLKSYQRAALLSDISIDQLCKSGIGGVLLDLDNTVVSEDDHCISPYAEQWIAEAKSAGIRFFLLSNGKRQQRVKQWSQRLEVEAFSPARKPLPFAFRHGLKQLRLCRKKVVVIGDGMHTDIVGAWLCGLRSIQVASLPHSPLRWWERLAGRWLQLPYPSDREVWQLDDLGQQRPAVRLMPNQLDEAESKADLLA